MVESFEFFQQRCNLYICVKVIPREKKDDHILLLVAEKGLRNFSSWRLDREADKQNPAITWQKFREQLELQINVKNAVSSARIYSVVENIEESVAR